MNENEQISTYIHGMTGMVTSWTPTFSSGVYKPICNSIPLDVWEISFL